MMSFEDIRYGLRGMADTHPDRPACRYRRDADPGWIYGSAPQGARARFEWLRAAWTKGPMFARLMPKKARARLAG